MKILIKISGEALRGKGGDQQYDPEVLGHISEQIRSLQGRGHSVALVVGGGNLFRGRSLTGTLEIERPTADYIGMLATVQNALVLRDYFNAQGLETRVSSAISMPQICEGHVPKRVLRHLEKGRVVIFAAGLGTPFFTTDTTAVERALELGMDLLVMAKNGVRGIHRADPRTDPTAGFISEITASELLEQSLGVADHAAVALAREHGLPIRVLSMEEIGRSDDATVGSLVHPR
jgi:uridylate kinase